MNADLKVCLNDIVSCEKNDPVLLEWSDAHSAFVVYQQQLNCIPAFLHRDSFPALGIILDEGIPNRQHTIGVITSKELCKVIKSGNRYKMPKGSHLYRVQAKPFCRSPPLISAPTTEKDSTSPQPPTGEEEDAVDNAPAASGSGA
ncbi:unnamed protein product [Cyprideis torosa]|uniref:Uncharacterized protein n=1 Tax=Cyprideis torosa TaxID=163714 RepID=A0A7R8ZIY6_9CRUS|nr:unnamed protein product [Cyprideis torosa]CAG0881064.1 unnamed protein product [Cyprideis torosa]